MKKTLLYLFILLFSTIIFTNCGTIHNAISKQLPSASTLEKQLASVSNETEKLSQVEKVDGVMNIVKNDFIPLVHAAYNESRSEIESKEIKNISNQKLKLKKVDLAKQGIKFLFNFSFTITEYNVNISGKTKGIATTNVNSNGLDLNLALDGIQLDRISKFHENKLIKKLGRKSAVEIVTNIIKHYLTNINEYFLNEPIEIPIDLRFNRTIHAEKLFVTDLNIYSNRDLSTSLDINTFVTLIDKDNILLLVTNDAVVLSNKEPIKNPKEKEFLSSLNKFQSSVNQNLVDNFNKPYNSIKDKNSFLLKNTFIAKTFNNTFGEIDVNLKHKNFIKIPEGKNKFYNEVRIHDKQHLPSCSGVREPFHGDDCGDCRQESCDGPCRKRDCPSCKWYDAPCLLERAACEAENLAREAGCVACKTAKATEKALCDAKVAACKVERETERILHQAENEAKVAECEAKRLALKFVDHMLKIAEIEGEFKVPYSEVNANFKSLVLNDELTELNITSDLKANAKSWVRVWVNPEGVGHIACIFNFRKTLENNLTYEEDAKSIKIKIEHRKVHDTLLLLKAITPNTTAKIKLTPSPYYQLIKDPGFVLNCSFLTIGMPTFAGIQLLREKDLPEELKIMFGRANVEIKSNVINIPISPIKVGKGRKEVVLMPSYNKKFIGFY